MRSNPGLRHSAGGQEEGWAAVALGETNLHSQGRHPTPGTYTKHLWVKGEPSLSLRGGP